MWRSVPKLGLPQENFDGWSPLLVGRAQAGNRGGPLREHLVASLPNSELLHGATRQSPQLWTMCWCVTDQLRVYLRSRLGHSPRGGAACHRTGRWLGRVGEPAGSHLAQGISGLGKRWPGHAKGNNICTHLLAGLLFPKHEPFTEIPLRSKRHCFICSKTPSNIRAWCLHSQLPNSAQLYRLPFNLR